MNLVWKLLRQHISVPQLLGFFFANLLGMLIVLLSIQFYNDIKPWLLKFKAMATEAISLLNGNAPSEIDFEGNPDFQLEILSGMGEDISLSKVTAEPAAQVLMPFIEWLKKSFN